MTREELLAKLRAEIADPNYDSEEAHYNADQLLLAYIGDDEISNVFDAIIKWYA